jgi:hypothetical protein
MHTAGLAIKAIPLILFAAAATLAISSTVLEDVFARDGGRYSGDRTSRAAAVNNDCLNPILDSNSIDNMVGVGNCGGTVSQQDESGQASAPITSQTANPTIELKRATSTSAQPPLTGESCEDCFNGLCLAEQTRFVQQLGNPAFATVDDVCNFLIQQQQMGGNILGLIAPMGPMELALRNAGVDDDTILGVLQCLNGVFNP